MAQNRTALRTPLVRSGVSFGQHISCRFCIIKAAQHIGDGGNGGVLDPSEDHVVVTGVQTCALPILRSHVRCGVVWYGLEFSQNHNRTAPHFCDHMCDITDRKSVV